MADYYFRNTGDTNWGTASNWSLTDGGGATGAVPTATDNAYFSNNSGDCVLNTSARTCLTIDFSKGTGYVNTLSGSQNLTVAGSVTFVAGMTLSCTGLLTISAAATLNWGGKTWDGSVTFSGNNTKTLASDISISGTLTISGTTTTSGVFNINTASLITNANISGSATIIFNSTGTWSGLGVVSTNITINTSGTLTLGTAIYQGSLLLHISGEVYAIGGTLTCGTGSSINAPSVNFGNITFTGTTFTLLNDLTINGTLTNNASINISGNYNIYTTSLNALGVMSGVPNLIFNGSNGTWESTGNATSLNIFINTSTTLFLKGIITYATGTLTNISGNVNAKQLTTFQLNTCTLINIHKIIISNIAIVSGATITMNQFFSGSANVKTRIQSTSTSNYTITFTDNFEKLAKFVKISNATITGRKLLIITNKGNANIGSASNIGIRYTNQVPNGISKNWQTVKEQACLGIEDGFLAEPLTK